MAPAQSPKGISISPSCMCKGRPDAGIVTKRRMYATQHTDDTCTNGVVLYDSVLVLPLVEEHHKTVRESFSRPVWRPLSDTCLF